jgi:hypothetical protein
MKLLAIKVSPTVVVYYFTANTTHYFSSRINIREEKTFSACVVSAQ